MEKYYFITYVTRKLGREFFNSDVIDEHPFNWIKRSQQETNSKLVLAGWQEISKEEYKIYIGDEITESLGQITVADPLELLNGDQSEGLES
jgi:hypothetical protein